MSRLRAAACAAVLGALVAGCSSSPTFTMTSGAGATLRADVFALTQAIADHKWTAADAALAQLRADLATTSAAGAVSPERTAAIRADAAKVAADLAAHRIATKPLPPLTSTSASKTPKPGEPKPPRHEHGHGYGHGHGHGYGHGPGHGHGHGHGGGHGD